MMIALLSLALSLAVLISGSSVEVNPLGPYKISDITVSGISAGGYMAVQLHVAYSSIINGSANFAAGPYSCAENNVATAEYVCMKTTAGIPNTAWLIELTKEYDAYRYIDSVRNLKDDKVYIFSGADDSVVSQVVGKALQTYFQYFLENYNIVSDFNLNAEHCFPTLNYGEDCSTLALPYIGKCHFDGAGQAFQALYGTLAPAGVALSKNFFSFNQKPYWPDAISSLADTGYIYVPTACQSGKQSCRLHISFHGCEQTQDLIGSDYATKIGMNEYAESNNIIVLYPYVKPSPGVTPPVNPNGCWDWWGYTNMWYATNKGKQMNFVRDLIKAVSGK